MCYFIFQVVSKVVPFIKHLIVKYVMTRQQGNIMGQSAVMAAKDFFGEAFAKTKTIVAVLVKNATSAKTIGINADIAGCGNVLGWA